MESEASSSCYADPNLAVIGAFFEKFGKMCGVPFPSTSDLVSWIVSEESVHQELSLLHLRLLRKGRRTVNIEKWERAAAKFCQTYSFEDFEELSTLGYLKSSYQLKLRLLKQLLEYQFDCNVKFKTAINLLTSEELRQKPVGKDKSGCVYWTQFDSAANLRVYCENPAENSWSVVASDRPSLVRLLHNISGDETLDLSPIVEPLATGKGVPVLDTGQSSDEDDDEGSVDNEEAILSDGAQQIDDDVKSSPERDEVTNKRKAEDEISVQEKKMKEDEEFSEEIEEPVMYISGEGNGADCETGNRTSSCESVDDSFECSEVVEEPVFYVFGCGDGALCDVGNPDQSPEDESEGELAVSTSSQPSIPLEVSTSASSGSTRAASSEGADSTVSSANNEALHTTDDIVNSTSDSVSTSLQELPSTSGETADDVPHSTDLNFDGVSTTGQLDERPGTPSNDSVGCSDSNKHLRVWSIDDICGSSADDVCEASSTKRPMSPEKSYSSFSIANVLDKPEESPEVDENTNADPSQADCPIVSSSDNQTDVSTVVGTTSSGSILNDILQADAKGSEVYDKSDNCDRDEVCETNALSTVDNMKGDIENTDLETEDKKGSTDVSSSSRNSSDKHDDIVTIITESTECVSDQRTSEVEVTDKGDFSKDSLGEENVRVTDFDNSGDNPAENSSTADKVLENCNVDEENCDKSSEEIMKSNEEELDISNAVAQDSLIIAENELSVPTIDNADSSKKEENVETSNISTEDLQENQDDKSNKINIISESEDPDFFLIEKPSVKDRCSLLTVPEIIVTPNTPVNVEPVLSPANVNVEQDTKIGIEVSVSEENVYPLARKEDDLSIDSSTEAKAPDSSTGKPCVENVEETNCESIKSRQESPEALLSVKETSTPETVDSVEAFSPTIVQDTLSPSENVAEPLVVESTLGNVEQCTETSLVESVETPVIHTVKEIENVESPLVENVEDENEPQPCSTSTFDVSQSDPVQDSFSPGKEASSDLKEIDALNSSSEKEVKALETVSVQVVSDSKPILVEDVKQSEPPCEEEVDISNTSPPNEDISESSSAKKDEYEKAEDEMISGSECDKKNEGISNITPLNDSKPNEDPAPCTVSDSKDENKEKSLDLSQLVTDTKVEGAESKDETSEEPSQTPETLQSPQNETVESPMEKCIEEDSVKDTTLTISEDKTETPKKKKSKKSPTKGKFSSRKSKKKKRESTVVNASDAKPVAQHRDAQAEDKKTDEKVDASDDNNKVDEDNVESLEKPTEALSETKKNKKRCPPPEEVPERKSLRTRSRFVEQVIKTPSKKTKTTKTNKKAAPKEDGQEKKAVKLTTVNEVTVLHTPEKSSTPDVSLKRGRPRKPQAKASEMSTPNDDSKNDEEGSAGTENDETESTEKKGSLANTSEKKGYTNQISARELKLINVDLIVTGERSTRQSRRIAQIKLKEDAERRHHEDVQLETIKKSKKSKKKKSATEDVDYRSIEEEKEKKESKKTKKFRFDHKNPWKSSSESSSQEEEYEEDEIEEEPEEVVFKSDHEFSPESDIEEDPEYQPTKKARTAREMKTKDTDLYADTTCEACSKTDSPDEILLCDTCDKGWHTRCLNPVLHLVPEGEWFCPPCSHEALIDNLKKTLREYDRYEKQRENEELRKKRLAFVGISLDNVLPSKKAKKDKVDNEDDKVEDDSSTDDGSSSGTYSSSEEEPVYQLRERRTNTTSYRYNEYDEMIRSAIQADMDEAPGAVKESADEKKEDLTMSTEKSTIVDVAPDGQVVDKPPIPIMGTANDDDDKDEDYMGETEDDDLLDEIPPVVPKDSDLPNKKKKKKKLTSLEFSSEEDHNSDSDFKGSASEQMESEEEMTGSDSSERWKSKRSVRRSTRTRTRRYDKDFINDDTSDDDTPQHKRREYDSTESSDSDKSWGAKKGKRSRRRRLPSLSPIRKFKKKKHKKKRRKDGSEEENVPKRRRIKYGLDSDSDDKILNRRTRGKKINYVEDHEGSESEEENKSKKRRKIGSDDSDAEFNADEEKVEDEEEEDAGDAEGTEGSDDSEEMVVRKKTKEPPTKGKGSSGKAKRKNKRKILSETEEDDDDLDDLDDDEEEKLMDMLEKGDIPVDQLKAAVKRAKEEKKKKDSPIVSPEPPPVPPPKDSEEKPKKRNVKITPTRAELQAAKERKEEEEKRAKELIESDEKDNDQDESEPSSPEPMDQPIIPTTVQAASPRSNESNFNTPGSPASGLRPTISPFSASHSSIPGQGPIPYVGALQPTALLQAQLQQPNKLHVPNVAQVLSPNKGYPPLGVRYPGPNPGPLSQGQLPPWRSAGPPGPGHSQGQALNPIQGQKMSPQFQGPQPPHQLPGPRPPGTQPLAPTSAQLSPSQPISRSPGTHSPSSNPTPTSLHPHGRPNSPQALSSFSPSKGPYSPNHQGGPQRPMQSGPLQQQQGPYPIPPQQNIHPSFPNSNNNFSPTSEPVKQRRKPGPKPGSKNRKKTEEEIQAAAAAKNRPRGRKSDEVTIATVQAPTQFPDAVAPEGGSVITRMLNSPQGARPLTEPSTRFPGQPVYHQAHPMDPSPSGGAAVTITKPAFNQENFQGFQNFQNFPTFQGDEHNFPNQPYNEPTSFPTATPPVQPAPVVPTEKPFDEEGGGEFGGLASYFASQAEEEMDP